jgi:L-ascorbate metabolism protein UlaG (beta-lactamase superfamily)
MERVMNTKGALIGIAVLLILGAPLSAQGQSVDFAQEPACQTLTATSMGGPAPRNANLLVLRYLGSANYEVAYRDTVLLLNAHYARVYPARSLGFTPDEVTTATAILIGHGHGDHMSDAPDVAQRTGAMLVGAPITATQAKLMGLGGEQIIEVTGRGQATEVQTFGAVTVEPMLARHGNGSASMRDVTGPAFRALMETTGRTRTPAQQEEARAAQQGSRDPGIPEEGTISYLLTFDDDFRLIFRDTSGVDSTGSGTEAERRVMERIGRTDVAIVSYSILVPEAQVTTMPLAKLYNPDIFLPAHHDQVGGGRLDTPMEPLFLKLRDEMPNVRPISPLYRTPLCFDTETKAVHVGVMAR